MKIYVHTLLNELEKKTLLDGVAAIPVDFADEVSQADQLDAFLDATVCFGNVPAEWLELTTQLQWIQLESAGFGEYQSLRKKSNFLMTNLKGFYGVPVAETAIAGVLALYRGIDRMVVHKQRKEWLGQALRPTIYLLRGARALVMGGSGSIGQHAKKLLTAFGAEVTVFGRNPAGSDITTLEELEAHLPDLDILICTLPGTAATERMLNRERLELLPSTAVFVNVGRGSIVEEPVLIEMIAQDRLRGAVLDVTILEPLPKDHPLWESPRVLLTQHSGGGYADEMLDMVKLFVSQFKRFQAGERPENAVDLKKGY